MTRPSSSSTPPSWSFSMMSRDRPQLDSDAAGVEQAMLVAGELVRVGEEDDVVGPLAYEKGVLNRSR